MDKTNRYCALKQIGILRVIAIMALALLAMLADAGNGFASDSDKVIAIVNGQKLRGLHFNRVMNEIMPAASYHGGVSAQTKARYWNEAIDRLINEELLYQEAKRLGIRPDKKAVNEELKKSMERVGGKDRFKEALVFYGVDEKEFKRTLAAPGMVKQVLERVVDKKATVKDSQIKEYYEKNKTSHFVMKKRRFLHIVFKVDPGEVLSWGAKEERAKDVLGKIREGADFEEMAKSFSEGTRKESGGDTGYLDRSQLLPELADAGWDLKAGEVSDLIKTIYGFHILKAVGEPIEEVMPFEEAQVQIRSTLVANKKQELHEAFLQGLRSKASIQIVGEPVE